jgi:hypothetical protein
MTGALQSLIPTVDPVSVATWQPNTQLSLTSNENAIINAALEAIVALKKTFENWEAIGHALKSLRAKADRLKGRKTFDRLREQAGLGTKLLDKTMASKLLRIMDELPAVKSWREGLTEKERFDWASPGAVLKHCPVFAKPETDNEKKPSKLEQTESSLAAALEENAKLKKEIDAGGGDLWTVNDRPQDIARVMVTKLSRTKAERVAREIMRLLAEKREPAPT